MAVHLKRKHSIDLHEMSEPSKCAPANEQPSGYSGSSLRKCSSNPSTTDSVISKPVGQLSIPEAFMSKLAPGSARAKLITRNLALYIATDLRPYSIVENSAFKNFVHCLEPKYSVPSRPTLSEKVMPNLYEEVRQSVQSQLHEAQTIAMTSDGWTSRATESYITITAHFIDSQWILQNKVLQTRAIYECHTGTNIAQVLKSAVDEWKLERPHGLQPLTSDSAANMCVAAKQANMTPHIKCFAHVINLAAQQALKISEVQRLLGRVRRVVNYFHKSSTASQQLKAKQTLLQLPNHKLLSEVKTRWNSAYDMLARYLEQQPAIMATLMSPDIKKDKDLDTLSSQTSQRQNIWFMSLNLSRQLRLSCVMHHNQPFQWCYHFCQT
ncbi:zinc finger BED domain-containing protein 4-like [Haliotis asinina]|uniref:zinc finger BED domain-containing protein 4-like n=1 Tax=Haliotis asinina TaxID=109174 RepID=UPI00353262C7